MHKSCLMRIEWWFENYMGYFDEKIVKMLDVGGTCINMPYSYDSKRIKRDVLDIADNPDVTICVKDNPYVWDMIPDESYDIVVSFNTFQHIEFFWLTVKEIYRILKPNGFFVLISPSNRYDGKYPYVCWGINQDGLVAIAKWGGLKIIDATIAGIPHPDADKLWDDPLDDAMLIAYKEGNEKLNNINFPRLNYKRNFDKFANMKRWIKVVGIYKKELISEIQKIYSGSVNIFGAGENGELLVEALSKEIGIDYLIDNYKEGIVKGISIKKPSEILRKDDLVLISLSGVQYKKAIDDICNGLCKEGFCRIITVDELIDKVLWRVNETK